MSYSCDETYDVYIETVVRARKRHTCDACKRAVAPGAYYARVFVLNDGDPEVYKRCGACQTTHLHLREVCASKSDGYDSFWPDERLNCGLAYDAEWGGPPPDAIAALPLLTDAEAGELLKPRVA